MVIHRAHRIPYDRAIELGGGHLVEIGNVIQTFPWELEAAIDEKTVAVFWVAGSHLPQTTLSLEETVEIAHAHGVPVIVDAAAQLPPLENLWRFTTECGADLVLFSGGKALQGPQASGLIVGSMALLDAVRANASPLQRFARAMKVGKEEICGLVAAVERYVALDHTAVAADVGGHGRIVAGELRHGARRGSEATRAERSRSAGCAPRAHDRSRRSQE